jgi:hypothetical protein
VTGLLLAHQGGWDEILMVLAPIAVFAGLLAIANRRASAIESQREREGEHPRGRDGETGGAGGWRPEVDGRTAKGGGPRDEPTDR